MSDRTSSNLHYYVINLARCGDRKERITRRLKHHGLLDRTKFIEAFDKTSPYLEWFETGNYLPKTSCRAEHACFLSHIKALRAFVKDDVPEGIILEDDAMPRNDFPQVMNSILEGLGSRKPNLLMLCHLVAAWDGIKQVDVIDKYHVSTISPRVFGAQAYWITREYAQLCLQRLDKSLRNIPDNFVTSELITRMSNGYFITPPLVVEEGVYSTLRVGGDLNVHRNYFSSFGLENYTIAEEGEIKTLWQPVG